MMRLSVAKVGTMVSRSIKLERATLVLARVPPSSGRSAGREGEGRGGEGRGGEGRGGKGREEEGRGGKGGRRHHIKHPPDAATCSEPTAHKSVCAQVSLLTLRAHAPQPITGGWGSVRHAQCATSEASEGKQVNQTIGGPVGIGQRLGGRGRSRTQPLGLRTHSRSIRPLPLTASSWWATTSWSGLPSKL